MNKSCYYFGWFCLIPLDCIEQGKCTRKNDFLVFEFTKYYFIFIWNNLFPFAFLGSSPFLAFFFPYCLLFFTLLLYIYVYSCLYIRFLVIFLSIFLFIIVVLIIIVITYKFISKIIFRLWFSSRFLTLVLFICFFGLEII